MIYGGVVLMDSSKMFWCRNCNEETSHEHIGDRKVEVRGWVLVRHYRKLPVYACKVCRCELVADEDGGAHLPSEFPVTA